MTDTKTQDYKTGTVFFSPGYIIAQVATLGIYMLGLKWTLFGLKMIPFVMNWFVYLCLILFWLYYNYVWVRTAICLPTAFLYTYKTYKALGAKFCAWDYFYIALSKVNKLRKVDIRIRREGRFIVMLAASFRKPALIANFKGGEAKDLSTAIFIHTKRRVINFYKGLMPYFAPTFIVILVLTPILVFLTSFNYSFLIEELGQPVLRGFTIYMLILPFKLAWVFMVLSVLASNILSPLVTLPCINIFADYVKENNVQLNLYKKHSFPYEGLMSLLMIAASLMFYISVLRKILL